MTAGRSGDKTIRVLLVSDQLVETSEQQFAPLLRNSRTLRDRFGVVVRTASVDQALGPVPLKLDQFHIVGLKLSFRTSPAEALAIVEKMRQGIEGAGTRFVYFDGDDDLNIQWPEVLRRVDLYVKKHVYSDPAAYTRTYIGKSNLTDHVARTHNVSFENDIIPASGSLSLADTAKIHLGWNIGLDDKIVELLDTHQLDIVKKKSIDVTCRAAVPASFWTYGLRTPAVDALERLSGRFRIKSPKTRVSQSEYHAELERSMICVSPFGFGEICWRDFEAVLFGCMIVKPDMGHVRTAPDIFERGVTYAAVKWDYSDLEEVCAYYLANEEIRLQVVQNARQRLLSALRPDWIADRFGDLLAATGTIDEPKRIAAI